MITYKEAMAYIEQTAKFGSVLGLDRIRCLLEILDNPQKRLKVIHVAGTNGKGSVCTFISSILMEAGYQVGRYVSPTIEEYRERIQINGIYIGKEELAYYIELVRDACRILTEKGIEQPTVFEIETAIAFLYFRDQVCDFVVLEVGLGGRYDSTNVVESPLVSVIGAVGLDHMHILGDTVDAIAYEKAGIIKKGRPVVAYEQDAAVMDVIYNEAMKQDSSLYYTNWEELVVEETSLEYQKFSYKTLSGLKITQAGPFQMKNAVLAVEAVWQLIEQGIIIEESHMRQGLCQAQWPGRFQIIRKQPVVVVDGAHNPDGAKVLAESIRYYFPQKKIYLIMGVFEDKDYDSILRQLKGISSSIAVHRPDQARGLDSHKLAAAAAKYYDDVYDAGLVGQALKHILKKAGPEDVIISFGSLSTIGPLCDIVNEKMPIN